MNMRRRESRENIVERSVSFNDIKRAEKKYINKAFDDDDDDDDDNNFMIQVNLNKNHSKTSALSEVCVDLLYEHL